MRQLLNGRAGHRPRARSRWRTYARWFGIVFAALVVLRLLLPAAVARYVNHVLAGMPAYHGDVRAVHVGLWRGSYQIEHLRLFQRGADDQPLLEMRQLDLSVQWLGLLRGRIVAEATCHHPIVRLVLAAEAEDQDVGERPPVAQDQTGADEPWAMHLDRLIPFQLNRFVVRDGEIRWRSERSDPPVDWYVTDFYLEALNIANVRDKAPGEVLLAEIEAAGRPFGTGELEARLRFDPFAESLRMELDASVRDVRLRDLNDFLRAYGAVDAEGGTLGIFAEFVATDGQVEGYVKTLFEHMRILRFREIEGPADALEALWEGVVAVAAIVLENQPHERLATKVPLRGTSRRTNADLPAALASLLRNAFFVALGPAIDDSIELHDMEVFVPAAGATRGAAEPGADEGPEAR